MLAFCAIFQIPISHAKLQLGSSIIWIGWHCHLPVAPFASLQTNPQTEKDPACIQTHRGQGVRACHFLGLGCRVEDLGFST